MTNTGAVHLLEAMRYNFSITQLDLVNSLADLQFFLLRVVPRHALTAVQGGNNISDNLIKQIDSFILRNQDRAAEAKADVLTFIQVTPHNNALVENGLFFVLLPALCAPYHLHEQVQLFFTSISGIATKIRFSHVEQPWRSS